jgi:adenylate cyclase
MAFETERKFLVDHKLWENEPKPAGQMILQGYISDTENGVVRVRVMGKNAFITIKGRSEGITRPEFEFPIPLRDALEMLAVLSPPVVTKTRYVVPFAGHNWEVDVFDGSNNGLIIAEIELDSEDEVFEKPAFAGNEVTSDRRYSNSYLARNPFSNW